MNMKPIKQTLLLSFLLIYSLPSQAQTALVDISQCLKITSTRARIACYDALAEDINPSAPALSTDPVISSTPPVITATSNTTSTETSPNSLKENDSGERSRQTSDDNFGLPQEKAVEANNEIVAIVSAIKELRPQRLLITMENGQVWRQTRLKTYRLRPEDEVRIYESSWGSSFRLATERLGSFIQVERVQ